MPTSKQDSAESSAARSCRGVRAESLVSVKFPKSERLRTPPPFKKGAERGVRSLGRHTRSGRR
jgi:hypothetical protein